MPAAAQNPEGTSLACSNCATRKSFILNLEQLRRLFNKHEVDLPCPKCAKVTTWCARRSDRRTGKDRRAAPQARVALPVRVRSLAPESPFTEASETITASLRGASFIVSHPIPEGSTIYVVVPYYDEGDSTLMEIPSRVVHVTARDNHYEIGVQFLI